MDFASREKVVTALPCRGREPNPRENEVAVWFARGIALEEDPNTQPKRSQPTSGCSSLSPKHAAAHINLGTLYYNRQDFDLAEKHYRDALEADPRYALAYFDLGNVLDETGRVQEAIQTYKTAIQLGPHLRGRALQSRARLRKDPRAAQGPEALAGLHQARYGRSVVGARPQRRFSASFRPTG